MRRVAPLLIAALVQGAVAVVISVKVYDSTTGVWNRLRAEGARFSRTSGFELLSREEYGTTLCFVACDEPRVRNRYRVEATSFEGARDAVNRAFVDVFGEAVADPPRGLGGLVYADLPNVGNVAYAVVGDIDCDTAPCVVAVKFTSGLE